MPNALSVLGISMTTVNWLDIKFSNKELNALQKVLNAGDISGFSPVISQFELLFQERIGIKHAIACANGTLALMTAFWAFERFLGKKLKIAVPTWTYIAPVNAADLIGEAVLFDSDIVFKLINLFEMIKDIGHWISNTLCADFSPRKSNSLNTI